MRNVDRRTHRDRENRTGGLQIGRRRRQVGSGRGMWEVTVVKAGRQHRRHRIE